MNEDFTFLEYSEERHAYYADGVELPSVTQIIKHAGLVSGHYTEEAAQRGTDVHRYCALDDLKQIKLNQVPTRYRGYVKAWRLYCEASRFRPQLIEHRLYELTDGYAGTLDRYGHRGERTVPCIIDIKTGVPADWAKYQLVAYASALSGYPQNVCERAAVQLMPNGQFRVKTWPITDFYKDLAEFRQMLKNYKQETQQC